jgi:hypothetical protein
MSHKDGILVSAKKIVPAGNRNSVVHPELLRPVTAVSTWEFVKVDIFFRCQRRVVLFYRCLLLRGGINKVVAFEMQKLAEFNLTLIEQIRTQL